MKEVQVISWCDHEAHDEGERVSADQSFTLTVLDGTPYEIDLCDEHAMPILEALTLMEERGTKVVQPRKKRGPAKDSTGVRPKRAYPNPPCPECGHEATTRKALMQHARHRHGKGIRELLGEE